MIHCVFFPFHQMAFFSTILSVDIRRMELSDLHRQSVQQAVQDDTSDPAEVIQPLVTCPFVSTPTSRPSHRLSSPDSLSSPAPQTDVSRRTPSPSPQASHTESTHSPSDRPKYEMPRRVKFFYFLAKFRIVQKFIMVRSCSCIVQ